MVKKKSLNDSALEVNKGIEQPSSLNKQFVDSIKKNKQVPISTGLLMQGILESNITILGRAITLIESTLPEHREAAAELVSQCLPYATKSFRIGISGVPGVGKSTFIEALGKHITSLGLKLAVLAVDPSSGRSKGSILGDKTRMEELASDPLCFIRPSPSAGSLGGVARKTRETITLCEAAGYEVILVETVGVGQSETTVNGMVDLFLLLMLAGAGDELQGIKRGIMEMADIIAINKADGDNIPKVSLAKAQIENALHLFPLPDSGWPPPVLTCSALNNNGIKDIWQQIETYKKHVLNTGFFNENRRQQLISCMHESMNQSIFDYINENPHIKSQLDDYLQNDGLTKESPYSAARRILDLFFGHVTK